MKIDLLILSFTLLILSYYVFLGLIYIYARTTNTLYVQKVKISTLGIGYILTSVSSLYMLGHMLYFIYGYNTINYIVWILSALYIVFTLTKCIPYKLYVITHKGFFSLNPQINLNQKIFKSWKRLNIMKVDSSNNYFIVHILDEDFGESKVPLEYNDYYKIFSKYNK